MLDFIMCNQCTRLFRTENLLWNHIKVGNPKDGNRKERLVKDLSNAAAISYFLRIIQKFRIRIGCKRESSFYLSADPDLGIASPSQ
jgi:hypothetical protein